MLRNYLKLALRNLSRQKAFSFINITGLAIGLACSMLILLWVRDELSFDRFHHQSQQIYRLVGEASGLQIAISPAPVGPALRDELPEVTDVVRLMSMGNVMAEANDVKFEEKQVFSADSNFFQVFDFTLVQGDPATALLEPNGLVVTEALARKYFGTTDVMGKTFHLLNKDDFKVTGVIASVPSNSHLQFDLILPWAYVATRERDIVENRWDNFNYFTYLVLHQPLQGADLVALETKIDTFYKSKVEKLQVNFHLQRLTDIHLYSKFMADVPGHGNAQYVTVFIVIAIVILLVACINFMNLATARSARRAKEVGLRKVAGAVRTQLIAQFLGEAVLISFMALILALVIVYFSLPALNEQVGKQLFIDVRDRVMIGGFVGITVLTGLLSGSYPALFLSGFSPIKVLKKDTRGGAGGALFRNVLVVMQFVISIVLLVGTAIVYQQLNFIRSKNLGFNKENLLWIRMRDDIDKKINPAKAALGANPLTANYSFATDVPTNLVSGTIGVEWQGQDKEKQIIFATLHADENFIPVYNMQLIAGRNFNKDCVGDTTNFILNEEAVQAMGFTVESAINQPVTMWQQKGRVVGVVKNFNFKPLQQRIEPLIIRPNTWGGVVVVKANPNRTPETIAALEKVWNEVNPLYPFAYGFVDQDLEKLYKSEKQIGSLFTVFAFLAIFISCLGLYGLSAYIAEQRTKEIGIRKALGASLSGIVYLLIRKFVVPVLAAMVVAAPVAYFAMYKWLQAFAYRVNFNWLFVLLAGVIAAAVSLLTVSYESIRAARVNPVRSLREE
jgi:putative ABC transport system permease protein